jgi:hypothetical protein
MRKQVSTWLKKPTLKRTDLSVLRFSPRAIVFGLQCCDFTLEEQLAILKTIFSKYGRTMDKIRREYLQEQVSALEEICKA